MSGAPFRSGANIGSMVISALFVVAGIVTLYDTTGYADRDSKVFPQAVAIGLIVFATISFVMGFLRPSAEGGFGVGDWRRRLGLVVTMLAASLTMPAIGFLAAGAIAFAGGLIAAMHERWSPRTLILYWGAGAVIMGAFYALFRFALLVPLP